MGIISEVKCARCDRKYSGFRTRCPYCGARRSQRGKHAAENDNTKGKLLLGIIFLVVLIVVVIVLVISSNNKNPSRTDPPASSSLSSDEGVSSVEGTSPAPSTSPKASEAPVSPSPSATPAASVNSIGIYYLGEEKEDVTLSIGEVIDFDCEIDPEDAVDEKNIKWASSDEDAFVVLQTGEVTAIGTTDGAELTVTAGGKTATCIIRIY
ncbi:MAG: hypothetical protein IKE57_05170 [Oscillospiraceae bacterium]|nr:hypothetical protein [Oscillospiraceae bacterium]